MLQIKNLVKQYRNVTAVNNISFDVLPGRIFGILGPNGAGKTTTIRTILNIIKPTSGEITFNGEHITKDFFNIIGYLPEERGLYNKSKVIDVLLYFGELKNLDRNRAIKNADYWLEKLSIPHYKQKKVQELSKGNQQKIQFIASVIHDPKLLILDEPFSGFDPINQQLIKETILDFVTSGKVIILSTHQMETAEKLCADILLINNGKEVAKGELSSIKKNFGTNNIKVGFKGDKNILETDPDVIHFELHGNYAELQIEDDRDPGDFLARVSNKINITHFSQIEPTLNKIFIDVMKESDAK